MEDHGVEGMSLRDSSNLQNLLEMEGLAEKVMSPLSL
jgi:hypothetical protein